jgi:5-methylcytosine-specific restriction endonuclease McrA
MSRTDLLSENEAAIRLGITPELLFEYTRFAPKTSLGHVRKLIYTIHDSQRGFLLDDLNAWDRYLQEPWADKDDKRPFIPTYVQRYLKVECGGKCALCGTGHKLEDAHILPYEESLSHYHHNLIRLCSDCHRKYDDGIIPRKEIESTKTKLIEQLRSEIRKKSNLFTDTIPSNIPQPAPLFFGREAELAELQKKLSENRVIIIQGIGGIGKTQLLLHALSQEIEPITTIWLDLDNYQNLEDLELSLRQSVARLGLSIDSNYDILDLIHEKEIRVVLDGIDRLAVSNWDSV